MRRSQIRKRVKRKKSQVLDIDITSLLDILVILLVFLLKSYNSSGVVFNVPKDISLPRSESKTINNAGVIVQVSTTAVYVDDKVVLNIKDNRGKKIYGNSGRIIPLYEELTRKKRKLISRLQKVVRTQMTSQGCKFNRRQKYKI